MGHRKNRKRERHGGQRVADPGLGSDFDRDWLLLHDDLDPFDALISGSPGEGKVVASRVCGSCREFVEDGEGGRGTCLHPGSGILSPWTDTQACDFFAGRGRR